MAPLQNFYCGRATLGGQAAVDTSDQKWIGKQSHGKLSNSSGMIPVEKEAIKSLLRSTLAASFLTAVFRLPELMLISLAPASVHT